MSTEPGIKFDNGKADWTLLPFAPLREVVGVLMGGVKKYSRDNWQQVPDGHDRYIKGAFRHLIAYTEGENIDSDFGLSHLAHAICCLLFALWFDLTGKKDTGGASPPNAVGDNKTVRGRMVTDLMNTSVDHCDTLEALQEMHTTLHDKKSMKSLYGVILSKEEISLFEVIIARRTKQLLLASSKKEKK